MNTPETHLRDMGPLDPNDEPLRALLASTRTVHIRDDGVNVLLARSALEGLVQQITETDVWCLVEHLTFLPPIGRWVRGEIRECDDGEAEVHVYGQRLLPYVARVHTDIAEIVESLPVSIAPLLQVSFTFDRRSFDPEIAEWIRQDSDGLCYPIERWSETPPLIFLLTIPVVWGAIRFLGSFLDELGKATGKSLATKIASWTKKRKQPDRKTVFELNFLCPNGARISGFVVAGTDELESRISAAIATSEYLASFAGLHHDRDFIQDMRHAAFFLDDDIWKLGWWTDGRHLFETEWFKNNPQDVEGVLGRPLFPIVDPH